MLNSETRLYIINLQKQVSKWRGLFFVILALSLIFYFIFFVVSRKDNSFGQSFTPYIARINIEGMITRDTERDEYLDELKEDQMVEAIILNVDSGGGTAIGGETLYNKIKEIAATKPVVTLMNNMATSAAYMITLGTEKIYAHNGTITGSIGVLVELPNIRKAAENLGIDVQYIRTSPLKAEPNLFSDGKNDESIKVMKNIINDFYDFFVNIVAENRNLSISEAKKLADGRIYSAKAAKENGLIDEIGLESDIKKYLIEKYNLPLEIEVKDYELKDKKSPFAELFGDIPQSISHLRDMLTNGSTTGFNGIILR